MSRDHGQRSGAAPAVGGGLLGIVVVNYASSRLLEQNLAEADLGGLPARVVVVDNYSSPEEARAVAALAAAQGWNFVALPANRGFGAGVNAGIRAARAAGCECFLLLNPDARVDGAVVAELRREVLADPLALVSPRIRTPDGGTFFAGSRLLLRSGRIRGSGSPSRAGEPAQEWVTGACLAVHDRLLRRIGELDESYFLYWEDVELSHRALSFGGRLVLREDLVAIHDAGGTQGARRGRAKSALYYRYNCRNRLRFAAQHLPRAQILRWLAATPAVSREILLRGGRRQLLAQPGLVWAAVRGSAAGGLVAVAALLGRRPPLPQSRRPVLVVHPGAELYGSDRMLVESVAGLVARGHQVVAALPSTGPLVAELESQGARVVLCRMPVLRKSALRPRGFGALVTDAVLGVLPAWRLVGDAGAAGVYVSTITIPLWPLLARLRGRRVTVHVHEAENTAPRVVRRLLALPALLAHGVLVNSRYSQEVLLSSAPSLRERSAVVYNGIVGPPSVTPPRTSLSGPVRLVYVGRLSPRKGPQVAVAVLAELAARGVNARLDLVGSVFPGYEWFESELRAQVTDAGLQDRVSFRGFVPDVWALLASSDAVLIPSVLDEPFGNTAVEAVLSARPVVVSATSGLREAAAGYASAQAVPAGDVPAWADAVERIVSAWSQYRQDAVEDAGEAAGRHHPGTYQELVARAVTDEGTP